MRIDADEERPVYAILTAIEADGLRRCEDMRLVEGGIEGRAAMAGGAETDALCRDSLVGDLGEIGRDEARQVDQHGFGNGFARQRTYSARHLTLHNFQRQVPGNALLPFWFLRRRR